MTHQPRHFSVAVPAYRYEKYLQTCLTSIFDKIHSDIELVLIDDTFTVERVIEA